ncbi:hypothetical protein NL676_010381 [Syzygium grande]|nr:hypothetical protein NL676_010381 [Syzygium grande]
MVPILVAVGRTRTRPSSFISSSRSSISPADRESQSLVVDAHFGSRILNANSALAIPLAMGPRVSREGIDWRIAECRRCLPARRSDLQQMLQEAQAQSGLVREKLAKYFGTTNSLVRTSLSEVGEARSRRSREAEASPASGEAPAHLIPASQALPASGEAPPRRIWQGQAPPRPASSSLARSTRPRPRQERASLEVVPPWWLVAMADHQPK